MQAWSKARISDWQIRSAGGSAARLPDLAKELVGLKVDVIVVHLIPAVMNSDL